MRKRDGQNRVRVRRAGVRDFVPLYRIGTRTPALRVEDAEFMTPQEFKWCLRNPHGLFLVAEIGGTPVGFLYANMKDFEREYGTKTACLVYLAVVSRYRRRGIGRLLYETCERWLQAAGVTYVYALANARDPAVIAFNRKEGFRRGHAFLWMSKRLVKG